MPVLAGGFPLSRVLLAAVVRGRRRSAPGTSLRVVKELAGRVVQRCEDGAAGFFRYGSLRAAEKPAFAWLSGVALVRAVVAAVGGSVSLGFGGGDSGRAGGVPSQGFAVVKFG